MYHQKVREQVVSHVLLMLVFVGVISHRLHNILLVSSLWFGYFEFLHVFSLLATERLEYVRLNYVAM